METTRKKKAREKKQPRSPRSPINPLAPLTPSERALIEQNERLLWYQVGRLLPHAREKLYFLDAQDVYAGVVGACVDGMVKAARRWEAEVSSFANYACQCMYFGVSHFIRGEQRRVHRLPECELCPEIVPSSLGDIPTPDCLAALQLLPQIVRETFRLFYEGHTFTEIAKIQNLPRSTISGRIQRAREILRPWLEAERREVWPHPNLNPT